MGRICNQFRLQWERAGSRTMANGHLEASDTAEIEISGSKEEQISDFASSGKMPSVYRKKKATVEFEGLSWRQG